MQYIDGGDTITRKQGSRTAGKKKSTFCPNQHPGLLLDSYPEQVDEFKIFKDDELLNNFKDHFRARNDAFRQ